MSESEDEGHHRKNDRRNEAIRYDEEFLKRKHKFDLERFENDKKLEAENEAAYENRDEENYEDRSSYYEDEEAEIKGLCLPSVNDPKLW